MWFSEIVKNTGIPKSSLDYNLAILAKKGIINREKGTIHLDYKTPLCFIFDSPRIPYAYLGLLGERSERIESETETAIQLFKDLGVLFEKIVVATTHRAVAEWESLTHLNVEWCLLSDEEISRVNTVEEKVLPRLVELMRNYRVVMDCTSATKPATIAYYRLATLFRVPLIYVYESRKELIWVISREDLKRELIGNSE